MVISEILFLISIFLLITYSYFSLILVLMGLKDGKQEKQKSVCKNYPTISILIPIRNEPEELVKELAQNLRSLKYEKDKIEIIVVDDSKRDWERNKAIFCSMLNYKVKYLHREKNRGFKPGALNDALKLSNGELIVCMDVDSRLPRDALVLAASYLENDEISYIQYITRPRLHNFISYGYSIFIEFRNSVFQPALHRLGFPLIIGYGYVIKRSVLEEVGGWREEALAEDLELSARLASRGYRGLFISHDYVLENPPATCVALRKQQERWIYGAFQTFIHTVKNTNMFRNKLLWTLYILLTSMFLGLTSNLIISIIPITTFLFKESISRDIFINSTLLNNIAISLVGIRLLFSLLTYGKLKDIMKGFIFGGILYNSLSLKTTVLFIKALLGKDFAWVVTPKSCKRRDVRNNIDSVLVITSLLYCVGALLSFFTIKILFIWVLSLSMGSIFLLYLEAKGV